jgi:hypothetical protein
MLFLTMFMMQNFDYSCALSFTELSCSVRGWFFMICRFKLLLQVKAWLHMGRGVSHLNEQTDVQPLTLQFEVVASIQFLNALLAHLGWEVISNIQL